MSAERYDIVVVGAGPAGGLAALTAARAGCRTLLIEKHHEIGVPLCCAEAISVTGLTDNIPLDPSWVTASIDSAYLESAGGETALLDHPQAGYVLSRRRMEQGIAAQAESSGCAVRTGTQAIGLRRADSGRIVGLTLEENGRCYDVTCEVIIAADGIESLVARWAGCDTTLPTARMDSAAQFLFDNVPDLNPTRMEFYFDRELYPGGYAWVFPKGNQTANVGVAIAPVIAGGRKAHQALRDFCDRRFHSRIPKPLGRAVGGIPEFVGRKFMLRDNVLITGDAARLLDSITGAGIANALYSGRYAADAAVAYLKDGRGDLKLLCRYPQRWMDDRGRPMRFLLWTRQIFLKMTNADIDAIIRAAGEIFGGRTVTSIDAIAVIKTLLRRHPRLLKLARHVVW